MWDLSRAGTIPVSFALAEGFSNTGVAGKSQKVIILNISVAVLIVLLPIPLAPILAFFKALWVQ